MNARLHIPICGCLVLSMLAVGGCGDFPDASSPSGSAPTGSQAVEKAPDGLAMLKLRARFGSAAAQFKLGDAYFEGLGVQVDLSKAAYWLQKATAQGYAPAESLLAALYQQGAGVPRDDAKAVALLQDAVRQGDVLGQVLMGTTLYDGRGVPKDKVKAAYWYGKAAEQGDADAQLVLGLMYREGDGVPQSDAQAVAWLQKAAQQGKAVAQRNLAAMYLDGRGVPQDGAKAAALYQTLAAKGDMDAAYSLAGMYEQGQGVPQDGAQAAVWYQKAAELGEPHAEAKLGLMYEQGRGVAQDAAKAAEWYAKAEASNVTDWGPMNTDGISVAAAIQAIYTGDFDQLKFGRASNVMARLVGSYEEAFSERCSEFMPANKVELTEKKCASEVTETDGWGFEVSRYCESWVNVRTGKYADPVVQELSEQLDDAKLLNYMDDLGKIFEHPLAYGLENVSSALSIRNGIVKLIDQNGCGSPVTKRFQDNLIRYGSGQDGIRSTAQ